MTLMMVSYIFPPILNIQDQTKDLAVKEEGTVLSQRKKGLQVLFRLALTRQDLNNSMENFPIQTTFGLQQMKRILMIGT